MELLNRQVGSATAGPTGAATRQLYLQAHRHREVGRLLVRHGPLVRRLLLRRHPLCDFEVRQVSLRIGLQYVY